MAAPRLTTATLTGIVFAVAGNVLISFALNLQKLAHRRLNSLPENASLLDNHNESRYLKSKLWWFGFLLMNVGEAGNFISYAYAPASVVAPLGTFALMSNCFFAPCMLGEQFKKRDLFGIILAITGAVTLVLASNGSDTKLNPDALRKAVTRLPFLIYSSVYIVGALILATLSHGNVGQKWVFVDVGLCALFGGFTVLSTKALSTLLTTEWIDIFMEWITYPVLFVLIATGVGQIRYLNRALMRFDSKVVIPTQFVLFTLSAIIGSAILYGDFEKATFHQTVAFLYGVATTFAGVFAIAWSPNHKPENDGEALIDVDDQRTTSPDPHLSVGRRLGVLVSNGDRDIPNLQNRRTGLNLIGLSPAKHLLLVDAHSQERRNDSAPEEYRRKAVSLSRTGASSITEGSVSRDDLSLM
ncbi:hypothetical protein APHAL10511_002003 [Amanita phalloides]|nr:hypothetical protein APHAL10511_002003 [Amanita phalloides]